MNFSKQNNKTNFQQYSTNNLYTFAKPEDTSSIQHPKIIKPKTISQTTTTTTRRYILNPSLLPNILPAPSPYRTTSIRSSKQHPQQHSNFPNTVSFRQTDYDLMGNSNANRIRSSSLNRKQNNREQDAILNIINYPLTENEIRELNNIRTPKSSKPLNISNKVDKQLKSPLKTTIPVIIDKNEKSSFEPYNKEKKESPLPIAESEPEGQKQKQKIRFAEEPKVTVIEEKKDAETKKHAQAPTPRITHSVSFESVQTVRRNNIKETVNNNNNSINSKDDKIFKEAADIVKTIENIDNALKSLSEAKKKQPTEYRVSVNVGRFNIDDINVQLIDDANDTKLLIHCLQIEPIESMMGNFLKKEFKKEIRMPKNVDIEKLETYFFNDILTFTCKYKQEPIIPEKGIINEIEKKEELPIIRTEILNTNHEVLDSINHEYSNDLTQNNSRSILKANSSSPVKTFDQVIDNIINSASNNTSRSSSNTNIEPVKESNQQIPRSNSLGKSVRFDEDTSDRLTEEAQEYNSSLYGVIRDGYNCLTKDSLENVYLTYFFKLPSCSPADRTQVKVENHSILRLKVIQERKMKDTNTSVKIEGSNLHQVVDDNEKVMFREFSRRCRLPTNLFKFDDSSVSVSFMNDVWVRVEIPIIEFLTISATSKDAINESILTKTKVKTCSEITDNESLMYQNEIRF